MNVIVADDEKWVRTTIVNTIPFKKLGLTLACEASNGLEALDLCKQHKPDILVTDIMMPGLTGLDLIKELKESLPDIKIVIISGYSEFEYAKTAMKYGIRDYILKPVDEEEITHILHRIIETISSERRKKEEERTLESDYNQALPIIYEKYLNKLLHPNLLTADTIKNKLTKYKISFPYPHFTVVLFSPNVPSALGKDTDIVYFKTMVMKVMERSLGAVTFSKSDTEYELVTIINHKNNGPDSRTLPAESDIRFNILLEKALKLCKRLFYKRFNSSISVGVSSVSQNIKGLPDLYTEACRALQMRFWEDNGNTFYYKAGILKKNISIRLSEEMLEEMAFQIKLSDCTSVYKYVDDLYRHFKLHDKTDPEQIKEFFWAAIQSIINKLNIQLSFIDYESAQLNIHPYEKLKRVNSLERLIDFTKVLVNDICKHYCDKNHSANASIIETAKKFIDQNFNQDVTLEQVAKYVHLSPAYFSEVFKKATRMSFIDYKTARKIETAKKLLTTTHLTINEISNKIGYEDPKYFSKLFKRMTETTPYEYREKNKA